jgi:putative SOS response-associated peptidase YedK
MCYSAMVWASYGRFVTAFKATISIQDFVRIYLQRSEGQRVLIPKGMDAAFADPRSAEEYQIAGLIDRYNADMATKTEAELFKQKTRLNTATRALQTKVTKKAQEDVRIATAKIDQLLGKLEDLRRTEAKARDSRIFPGTYAPVMFVADGQRVVAPMRYQCRPAGKPANYDTRYPGTYNARRDNLEGFWKGQFGVTHGLVVAQRFYEHVQRDDRDVVLEFSPQGGGDMLVACLWSRWIGADGEELLSWAAITDEPPPEVAAAGHDRCIIPIKPEHVDAWLNPQGRTPADLYAILDDRERPYYEHRLAA